MNKSRYLLPFIVSLVSTWPAHAGSETRLDIYQVMQRVLDRYPALKISAYDVELAAEQQKQVESSLGWILQAKSGAKHDLSAFGTPSDTVDINGGISRQLASGGSLSVTGGYHYEDSAFVLNSSFPNPSYSTRFDIGYRMPLLKGKNNPLYTEGKVSAEAGYELAKANLQLTRITVAEQVKDLFYGLALTRIRLENARQAVARTKKLQAYILKNVRLGLLDKKDKLQVQAQLNSTKADYNNIKIQLHQQTRLLNRLLQDDWDQTLMPLLLNNKIAHYDIEQMVQKALNFHPLPVISRAKLKIAESKINSSRDEKKDSLDMVVSIGARRTGNAQTKVIKATDWAGEISLEYRHLFDERGVSAKYRKAQLEKSMALQELKKNEDDIRYNVSGLISEIAAAEKALRSANVKKQSEAMKLKEAEQRYRTGRADIAQLIQFQNEYSFSQLAVQNRKVDLNSRIISLKILTGQFWDELQHRHGVKK